VFSGRIPTKITLYVKSSKKTRAAQAPAVIFRCTPKQIAIGCRQFFLKLKFIAFCHVTDAMLPGAGHWYGIRLDHGY
jgi:hypothetical protein